MPSDRNIVEFLRDSRLELDDSSADALAAEMWTSSLSAGEYLFHQGQPSDRFFVVRRGEVDVSVSSPDGRELVFTTLGPGEPIGEATIIEGLTRSASIRARTDTTLLTIGRPAFLALTLRHPPLAMSLARLTARTLRRLSTRVEGDTFDHLERRLAILLLELGDDRPGGRLYVQATQQTLADRLGVTRESVNKRLRAMADQGIVVLGRGSVTVLVPAGLATID